MRVYVCLTAVLCAAAQTGFSQEAKAVRRVIEVRLPGAGADALKANTTYATVPTWSGSQGAYNYTIVGANPTVAQTNQTTTIPTLIVPLAITIPSGSSSVTFDPTVSNSCQTAGSALSLLQASPIFSNSSYTVGGTSFGSTLYHDFFQRANFYQYTGPSGVNPDYHILFSQTANAKIAVSVPAADGQVVTATCGKLGEINITWFDSYLQSTVFPKLASAGVTPSTFVVFLMNNVAMYQSTVSNCCALGYHSSFSNPAYNLTTSFYAVGDFDTTQDFGVTQDSSPLSHEMAEFMNDPMDTNPTPGWGGVGQVTGCQYTLEVADPLTGTDIAIAMPNGYTYHVQELAFLSWFYHLSPSQGVNGWYSSNDTFKTPAGPCETSTTTLSMSPTSTQPGSSVTVKIGVAAGAGFSGTPTGTVTLVQGTTNTVLGTYTLSSGSVSTTTDTLPAGSYTVTANYGGDSNFEASVSPAVTMKVGSSSVSLSPTSLSFGSVNVGAAAAAQTVTLKNSGNAPLTGVAVSLAGASPGDYSQTNTCGTSVAAGASCTISVTFTPTASGSRTASVSIADNASGSPQTVPLSGTGLAAAVSLSPSSLTFASTAVGSSAAAQSVTLTNSGNAALSSVAISLAGADAADFSETNTCGTSVAAGAKCTISVTFKPTAAGSRTASVSIADSASGSPQTVSLSGTGAASAPASSSVTVSPMSLTFPSTKVGSSSAAQTITVTNNGTAAVTAMAFSITGSGTADFSETNTCGTSLAAGGSCKISVTFKPAASGAVTASVTVTGTGGFSQTVTLTGTGASAAVFVSPQPRPHR